MSEMTCEFRQNGKVIARETVEANSEAVARNSVLMKLSSHDDVDWEDDYTVSCG